jgi:hypothetical protein
MGKSEPLIYVIKVIYMMMVEDSSGVIKKRNYVIKLIFILRINQGNQINQLNQWFRLFSAIFIYFGHDKTVIII